MARQKLANYATQECSEGEEISFVDKMGGMEIETVSEWEGPTFADIVQQTDLLSQTFL